MNRYWRGITKNNKVISEKDSIWTQNLKSLELVLEDKGQIIKLPKNMEYVQAKTCGANLGSGECLIESRFVGFKLGNSILRIRVDEKTSNISIEIE